MRRTARADGRRPLSSTAARAAVLLLGALAVASVLPRAAPAQQAGRDIVSPSLFQDMDYRMVGPYRGGRATAEHGVPGRPHTFWLGTTGGGVWKTTNGGTTWRNVSDGYFGGSIGEVTVAPSDPSVVWVGEGSAAIRGNISVGRGVWRTVDGGETWSYLGLPGAGQIGRIEVHPRDPDVAYVAAAGNPFRKNEQRGVFRTTDGGDSWEKVLFLNDSTGVVDLAMHPERPDVVFAAAWRAERKPWDIVSGTRWSDGAGLWRTTDGGETWEHLAGGLPDGDQLVGKVGVAISPADPDRVWANVEAERPHNDIYRSDDGGDTWRRMDVDPGVLDHPYYHSYVVAHPTDPNTVYVPDEFLWVSHDGGSSFERVPVPHGDVHGLWINPRRPETMITSNDGGGQVSVDGGETWTGYYNQPTAQFYRLEVDESWPYNLYGAQQDNSTMRVPSMRLEGLSKEAAWRPVGGGESGHIAIQSYGPDIVWAGSYGGNITRKNMATGRSGNRQAYPEHMLGMAPKEMEYRFQWNAPIEVDPHDSTRVFHAAQKLLVTDDGGHSWSEVSADLTYDDTTKQRMPGRPITGDATGPEIYNTIFTVTPSEREEGVIWVGTDDGRVWLTRDGAAKGNWAEVTPPGLPKWSTVNAIDLSPHDPGTAYVTAYRYRLGDFAPYVFRTEDYGGTWTRIADGTRGIPGDVPSRVVREDPVREGLLFAGTEFGMYVSFDDGGSWQSLQLDLPEVPVTDLAVKRGDLAVATQGRSFWVLDDLTPLREASAEVAGGGAHLHPPRAAYLWQMDGLDRDAPSEKLPENPPEGAVFDYVLQSEPAGEVHARILDADGNVVAAHGGPGAPQALPSSAGHHRIAWDLRTDGVDLPAGVPLPRNYTGGYRVGPGTYTVELAVGRDTLRREFEVRIPPPYREELAPEDLQALASFAGTVRDSLQSVVDAVSSLQGAREQVTAVRERLRRRGGHGELVERAGELELRLEEVSARLHNPEWRVRNDAFQYPPRLDARVAALYGAVVSTSGRPTEGSRRRMEDLMERWSGLRAEVDDALAGVEAFADALGEAGLGAVITGASGE